MRMEELYTDLYARKRRHQASTSIGVLREVPLRSGFLEKNP